MLSPATNARPLLLFDRANGASASPIVLHSPTGLLKRRNKDALGGQLEGEDFDDGWTVVRPQNNITRAVLSAFNAENASNANAGCKSDVDGNIANSTRSPKWHDHDFPPLRLRQCEMDKEGDIREA